jgi:hypothetical protein
MTETLLWLQEPTVRLVPTTPKASKLECSLCRVELGVGSTLAGENGEGTFCSEHCRNCVLALAALHPSVLASHEFVSRRGLLIDQLLNLWRHGRGPDPRLVLEAAQRASRGMAAPRTPASAGGGASERV